MNLFAFDFVVENVTKFLSRVDGLNVILTSKSAHDNMDSFVINHDNILHDEINLDSIKNKEYVYDKIWLWIELHDDIQETTKLLIEKYPYINKIHYNMKDMLNKYEKRYISKIMKDNGIEVMVVCNCRTNNNKEFRGDLKYLLYLRNIQLLLEQYAPCDITYDFCGSGCSVYGFFCKKQKTQSMKN